MGCQRKLLLELRESTQVRNETQISFRQKVGYIDHRTYFEVNEVKPEKERAIRFILKFARGAE